MKEKTIWSNNAVLTSPKVKVTPTGLVLLKTVMRHVPEGKKLALGINVGLKTLTVKITDDEGDMHIDPAKVQNGCYRIGGGWIVNGVHTITGKPEEPKWYAGKKTKDPDTGEDILVFDLSSSVDRIEF